MSELRVDPTVAYDVVTLPSNGIYYPTKVKSLRVAYLDATDEDILTAPNLVAGNGIINELLKKKILDRDVIPVEDLVEEDRQAILIFLRNTAWGSTYKITATDPKTDKPFDFELDLSVLKTKEFNLVEDSNGEYPYHFKGCDVNITFKFLNQQDERDYNEIIKTWNGNGVAPISSKKLEMMIKSVAGNRDQMNIRNLILKLPIKDAQDFKKFISENKPGLDLVQTIKTPSGDNIQVVVGLGVEFFRPFYGL